MLQGLARLEGGRSALPFVCSYMVLFRSICGMMSLAQHTEFRMGKAESKEMRCFSVLGSAPLRNSYVMASTSWLSWTTFRPDRVGSVYANLQENLNCVEGARSAHA